MSSPADPIRSLLRNIILPRKDIALLACRQRAKFEGWLKFELAAAMAKADSFSQITLEDGYPGGGRSDISFVFEGRKWYSEMKTANTNWRGEGLENVHRPVTRNIGGIIEDILILREKSTPARGIAIFCLFPVPVRIWEIESEKLDKHLRRIENECGVPPGDLKSHAGYVEMTKDYGICTYVIEVV